MSKSSNKKPVRDDASELLNGILERWQQVRREVAEVVVGQDSVVRQLLVSLMCGGHVLLEGAPGLGKTLLVKTLGTVCGLEVSRIQFTPDLMPADITGTFVMLRSESGEAVTRFQKGPLFAQLVLADEINRATPKTQSALLEAMQEHTVTAAGQTFNLPEPFVVLATQNPIEMEGTYLLPEAQVDRFFFKVNIEYPSEDVLDAILSLTTGAQSPQPKQVFSAAELSQLQQLTRTVPLASHVRRAVVQFVQATQPEKSSAREVQRYIRFGVSPRGAQALVLAAKANALISGRYNVAFSDLREVLLPTLRHRFQPNFEGEAEGVATEALLRTLFEDTVRAVAE